MERDVKQIRKSLTSLTKTHATQTEGIAISDFLISRPIKASRRSESFNFIATLGSKLLQVPTRSEARHNRPLSRKTSEITSRTKDYLCPSRVAKTQSEANHSTTYKPPQSRKNIKVAKQDISREPTSPPLRQTGKTGAPSSKTSEIRSKIRLKPIQNTKGSTSSEDGSGPERCARGGLHSTSFTFTSIGSRSNLKSIVEASEDQVSSPVLSYVSLLSPPPPPPSRDDSSRNLSRNNSSTTSTPVEDRELRSELVEEISAQLSAGPLNVNSMRKIDLRNCKRVHFERAEPSASAAEKSKGNDDAVGERELNQSAREKSGRRRRKKSRKKTCSRSVQAILSDSRTLLEERSKATDTENDRIQALFAGQEATNRYDSTSEARFEKTSLPLNVVPFYERLVKTPAGFSLKPPEGLVDYAADRLPTISQAYYQLAAAGDPSTRGQSKHLDNCAGCVVAQSPRRFDGRTEREVALHKLQQQFLMNNCSNHAAGNPASTNPYEGYYLMRSAPPPVPPTSDGHMLPNIITGPSQCCSKGFHPDRNGGCGCNAVPSQYGATNAGSAHLERQRGLLRNTMSCISGSECLHDAPSSSAGLLHRPNAFPVDRKQTHAHLKCGVKPSQNQDFEPNFCPYQRSFRP